MALARDPKQLQLKKTIAEITWLRWSDWDSRWDYLVEITWLRPPGWEHMAGTTWLWLSDWDHLAEITWLRAHWDNLGEITWPITRLRDRGRHLEASWGIWRHMGGTWGDIWKCLEASGKHLGRIWEASGGHGQVGKMWFVICVVCLWYV